MRPRSKRSRLRTFLQMAAIAGAMLSTRASFADHYVVPTGSMEPTVHVGDHVFVDKVAYGLRVPLTSTWVARFEPPARGDVVVLSSPEDGKTVLLKRVAAVAGDEVEVRGGHVLIGGNAVAEPWASLTSGAGPDFGPVVVPAGRVLVLGDNRGNSKDGREIGWVDAQDVLGRAVAVLTVSAFDRGSARWCLPDVR